MKNLSFLFLVIFFTLNTQALFSQKLSDNAEISIITCGCGNELYSIFGHSAIRINDPVTKFDYVYNYGTFDFGTPGFYPKFVRGQLDYMLSVAPYRYFIFSYIKEKRWVKEQVLNITTEEKNIIFNYVQNNALPENKFYRYDFLQDNCATRIKDVLKYALKNKLVLGKANIDSTTSYRDILAEYLPNHDWERVGIYLAMGMPADKTITDEQATFIPDYLATVCHNSKLRVNNKELPLIKLERTLYEPENGVVNLRESKSVFSPLFVFWIIFLIAIIISIYEIYLKKYIKLFDNLLFFIIGLLGILVLLLWFATEHKSMINNLNILWAMPLFLPAMFFYYKEKYKSFAKYLFLSLGIISLISLIPFPVFPQQIETAFTPLILTISIRSILMFIHK